MALALVDFFDLRYDRQHKSPVLFLKDVDNEQFLPVWIGDLEARSIEDAYYQRTLERPLTHDLLVTLLSHLVTSFYSILKPRDVSNNMISWHHQYHCVFRMTQ